MGLNVAVVGAGMAGLVCARRLQAAGAEVTVFEKSRGPGGRCATRRSDHGLFHHGAPSFAARGPAFAAEVAAWLAAGWVRRAGGPGLWVGAPTLNALARQLATGLRVQTGQTVTGLVQEQAQGPGGAGPGWRVLTAENAAEPVAQSGATPPRFDAVVLAVPAEQALALTDASVGLQAALQTVRSEPCWTLMLAWPAEAAPSSPPAPPADGPLAAVVDCSALAADTLAGSPAPAPAVRWTLHARPDWSREHLELPADEAAALLRKSVAVAYGAEHGVALPPASHGAAHRWRYAQVRTPAAAPFGWDIALHLGACGDAWQGSGGAVGADGPDGVERAWLSAQALAAALLREAAAWPRCTP